MRIKSLLSTCVSAVGGTKVLIPRLWLVILLLAIWTPRALTRCYAQGTIYTSRSTFDAAVTSSQTITFEEVPPSSPFSLGEFSITSSSVTFSNLGGRLFVTSPTSGIYPIPGTGQYLWNFDSSTPVGISSLPGATAFGADFSGGISPQTSFNATLTVNLVGGPSYAYNFSGPRGSWTFFGVTFSQPIASLVYDDGGAAFPGSHEEILDNVTFATAVPEPSYCLLAILGLIVSRWPTRRRSNGLPAWFPA